MSGRNRPFRLDRSKAMTTADIKSQIVEKVERLSPSLLNVANEFLSSLLAETLQISSAEKMKPEEESEADPLIGMIDGSPGVARNAEDILQR